MALNLTARPPHKGALSDVDLRLLRVFAEIVRCNGFSAAQASLGMTQATISAHMRHLEDRLGVRLCERGRSGFYLTNEGKQIHSAVLDLFGSDHIYNTCPNLLDSYFLLLI